MPTTSEAKRRCNAKYDRNNTKQIHLKLNINTDGDILRYLSKKENIQGYIKSLIREDMNKAVK